MTFTVIALSGIALFLRPEGSIARLTGWTFFGLSKGGWEGLHSIFAGLFLLSILFHLFFNWKVLAYYFTGKSGKSIRLKKEISAAAVVLMIFLAASIYQLQPVWKLIDLRQYLKNAKYMLNEDPAGSYAEKITLNEISLMVDIPPEEVLSKIRKKGYIVKHEDISLSDLAMENDIPVERCIIDIFND